MYHPTTKQYANHYCLSSNIKGGSALSNDYNKASGRAGKHKKMYEDFPRDILKLTCLIHGNGSQSSYQCKILNNFLKRYAAEET